MDDLSCSTLAPVQVRFKVHDTIMRFLVRSCDDTLLLALDEKRSFTQCSDAMGAPLCFTFKSIHEHFLKGTGRQNQQVFEKRRRCKVICDRFRQTKLSQLRNIVTHAEIDSVLHISETVSQRSHPRLVPVFVSFLGSPRASALPWTQDQ